MGRKNNYFGGIIGASPLVEPINPADHFNAVTYSGNNGTQTVTGAGFQPSFVWLKSRTNTYVHGLFDTVRGAGYHLMSHLTNGNIYQSSDGYLSAFNADGFTLVPGSSSSLTWNSNTQNYIAWCWKAGGAPTATNTSGTAGAPGQTPTAGSVMIDGVASTAQLPTASIYPRKMSVNTQAGFSVVQWSGTESVNGEAIPHGLNSAPELIIFKSTLTGNWIVGSDYLGNTAGWNKQLYLNLPNTVATSSASFNNTAPTSSTFTVGASDATNDTGTDSMIAYCFHSVPGYSKCGSYTGDGGTNNYVELGFRPSFVLIKRATVSTGDWVIVDDARNTSNPRNNRLFPNSTLNEQSNSNTMNFSGEGFTLTTTDGYANATNSSYIFMAFAA